MSRFAAHDFGEAGQLGDRLTFHSERGQQRSDLRVGAQPGHDLLEHRFSFFSREVDAVDRFLDRFIDQRSVSNLARLRGRC